MKKSILVTGLLSLLMSGLAIGDVANQKSKIVYMMTTTDGTLGGCAVQLEEEISSVGLDCPSSWVTFSCGGTHVSKEDALRMWDSAQMAYVMGKEVRIRINDAKKLNSYCVAERILIL